MMASIKTQPKILIIIIPNLQCREHTIMNVDTMHWQFNGNDANRVHLLSCIDAHIAHSHVQRVNEMN